MFRLGIEPDMGHTEALKKKGLRPSFATLYRFAWTSYRSPEDEGMKQNLGRSCSTALHPLSMAVEIRTFLAASDLASCGCGDGFCNS